MNVCVCVECEGEAKHTEECTVESASIHTYIALCECMCVLCNKRHFHLRTLPLIDTHTHTDIRTYILQRVNDVTRYTSSSITAHTGPHSPLIASTTHIVFI